MQKIIIYDCNKVIITGFKRLIEIKDEIIITDYYIIKGYQLRILKINDESMVINGQIESLSFNKIKQ